MVCVLIINKKFYDRNEIKLEKMFDIYFDICMNMVKYIINRLLLILSLYNLIIVLFE